MGFWQGVNAAVTDYEDKKFAADQKDMDRKLRKSEREEDKAHDFKTIAASVKANNEAQIDKLRAAREGADSIATNTHVTDVRGLRSRLAGGAPDKVEEYLKTVNANPALAAQVLNTVAEIEKETKSTIPTEVILEEIRLFNSESGAGILSPAPEYLYELEKE